MAKRRFKAFRRRTRSSSRGLFGRRSRSVGAGRSLIQIDSMAYGALRPMIANLIAPVTNMIPLGGISDEVGMGLLNYFVAKKTGGLISQVATKGLVVENAMIGSSLGSGLVSRGTTATSTTMFG